MRVGMLLTVGAVVLALFGCSVYGEVRSVVEKATPEDAVRIGDCFESGAWGVIDDVGYSCAYFVPGTRDGVARAIAERLAAEGFAARCQERGYDRMIELHGERAKIRVDAEISPPGYVIDMDGDLPLNISREAGSPELDYRHAPRGNVIAKLGAYEREGGLYPEWRGCLSMLRPPR
jgi:hypothetical protein